MRELRLSNGAIARVDDDVFDQISHLTWGVDKNGYVRHTKRVDRRTATIFLHRMVLSLPPGHVTDHIDRDRLNCQRANLRPVTTQQNTRNRSKSRGTSSQYKGVVWNKRVRKWQAQIRCGKLRYLGVFVSERAAAEAYNRAAAETFGQFAVFNQVVA